MLTFPQLTGFAILPMALLGTICNWTAVYILQKLPAFRHSFGYLSTSQAIADAIHSMLFLIWFCPMVISDSYLLEEYSRHCGFLLLFCYELSVQTHLIISLNRFFAVWTPYKYNIWFSDRNTKIIIAILWTITLLDSVALFEVLCNMFYDETTGFFTFTDSQLCEAVSWYADFCKYITIIIIIVIIDLATILKVRSLNKKVLPSIILNQQSSSNRVSTREINFLKQTVFQGSIFALELLTYFLAPQYLSNPWAVFFGTSFAWVTVHAMDGVILMVFNPEFKKFIMERASRQVSTSGTQDSTLQK